MPDAFAYLNLLAPEIVLVAFACILFLLGTRTGAGVRSALPWIALCALVGSLGAQVWQWSTMDATPRDIPLRLDTFAVYIRVIANLIAVPLLLLAWPTRDDHAGNSALQFGFDGGEFYALFLLSLSGLLLVAIAQDLIILFLALELVSIPTYVMVSISRHDAAAQEAGVKYFFLGAMSVAVMLLGFSFLYGSTGHVGLDGIAMVLRDGVRDPLAAQPPAFDAWQKLGLVLVIVGFAYKMAAFPLHFYAGDVYEGAGTPVTAFLAFVPKAAGFTALIRLLHVAGGPNFALAREWVLLLFAMAVLTMTIGNVLGLLQTNVKRVLAYSSIAHSGYMLVGIATLPLAPEAALSGVMFYLAAYGLMNSGAFGVLMLLPARDGSGSAETFDDIAGQGRRHVALGLAMAVSCFSLIGIPLTVGFIGKFLLIAPVFRGEATTAVAFGWHIALVIVLVINAAISAAYYLWIVGAMFLRPMSALPAADPLPRSQFAVALGVVLSVLGSLLFGAVPPAASALAGYARTCARLESAARIASPAVASDRRPDVLTDPS